MKATYSLLIAASAIALLSLLLPLPLAELGLALSLALVSRAVAGRRRVAVAALAIYLAARGAVNFFVAGAAWAVEPLPLLAAGHYLSSRADRRNDQALFAASRALYFAAVLAFLTAPFLPQAFKDLWISALLISVGNPLRKTDGASKTLGAALEALGWLSAIAFLVAPLSIEASNDILYISLISVPAAAIASNRGGGEEYIPTAVNIWIAADDRRLREAAEAYVERGDAEAIIAVLSYAYALAGIPLDVAISEALALKGAKGKGGRKAALEAALARLRGR